MQVAAAAPRYVSRDEVPADRARGRARDLPRAGAQLTASRHKVIERIVEGQVERFYKDVCLLEQPFIKQSDRTVGRDREGSDRPVRGERRGPPLRPLPARGDGEPRRTPLEARPEPEPAPDASGAPRYRRVLLKISGEALAGPGGYGIDPAVLRGLRRRGERGARARLRAGARHRRRQHLPRPRRPARAGIDRATGDYMGMLATVINALALQDALEKLGVPTRVLSAIEIQQVAEPYIRRRADAPPREGPRRHLRRRHRQPVLHHRHGREPARHGDRRRGHLQGDARRRRLRRRSR